MIRNSVTESPGSEYPPGNIAISSEPLQSYEQRNTGRQMKLRQENCYEAILITEGKDEHATRIQIPFNYIVLLGILGAIEHYLGMIKHSILGAIEHYLCQS